MNREGYSEQDGQVILTMSREDYEKLLICLSSAAGAAIDRRTPLYANTVFDLTNRLNEGNPNYTPYQVEDKRGGWPQSLTQAMSVLANLFPTMRGVPGTDPWDVHKLMAWMNTGAPTTGSWAAAMFLLGVWNPHTKWNQEGVKMRKGATGKFDLFVAMQGWDQQHIDAAMEWIQNPFFP